MTSKEFKLKQIFEASYGDFDIKKIHINNLGINVITAGETDYGVLGKTDINAKIFPANTITVDMFGSCKFRTYKYKLVTHARVFSLKCYCTELNEQNGLYLTTLLQKIISCSFNYNNMCSWNKIQNLSIYLPVIESSDPKHEYTPDDIDWQYMQECITELEQERISELDAYLKASGLNDYELTDEDKEVLSLSTKCTSDEANALAANCKNGKIRFKNIRAIDLFDIKKGKRLTKADMVAGQINFVGSSATNNGITARIGNTKYLHPAHTVTVSYNGSVGEVFLQNEPFWASDDVNVWYPKFSFNTEVIEYMMTVIKKCREKYSYSAKWTLEKMKEEKLRLPVTADDQIDFDYMERYIRAIEKLTIADVVKYKDQVIATTKKVVA